MGETSDLSFTGHQEVIESAGIAANRVQFWVIAGMDEGKIRRSKQLLSHIQATKTARCGGLEKATLAAHVINNLEYQHVSISVDVPFTCHRNLGDRQPQCRGRSFRTAFQEAALPAHASLPTRASLPACAYLPTRSGMPACTGLPAMSG